jgi:hypothetical protein
MPAKRPRKAKRKSPRFIPGIYNYCDRWCERCEFSHRCSRFALGARSGESNPAPADMSSRKFWQRLGRMVADGNASLRRTAKRRGINIDDRAIAAATAYEKRLDRKARAKGQNESKAALAYAHMVDEWFNNELRLPLRHVRNLERGVEAGTVKVAAAKGELVRLNDCVEVIRWYQNFIYVKVCRAFSSFVEEEGASRRAGPRDSAGSAKIALIAIERSIEAWVTLRELFPEETDSILELLVHLDRLRRRLKARFPRAMAFKRPGFDDRG